MKYPILYKSDETDFFAMGLGPIEMLKATVTQERNGIFVFEGEILTDNPLFPLVLENCIIKVDADHLLKDQRFRIKRIVPNHNGKAEIYAEHVSYLSRELTIKPEVNITGSAQVALTQWKASIVEANPFVVSSDITTSASAKWRIDKVSNPMMALGGVEGSILDRWGGEYLFDNYHIRLLKKRGTTAQTVLAYGRNITDFEQERNILSTYTSVAPYAIYTDDREREVIITVDGYVVDSEHVDKYPNRVTKPIDFSSEFGSGEIPTKARLTTLAQQYIADNEIGVPTTSIKISFLDLSQTADYADYAFLEQVNLCDDVRVHYPKLGVNTIAKVVRVVWNCLTESYDEIEIGQKRMSLASQIQEQNKVIQEINTQTNQAQVSADGKNMIFYGLYGTDGLGQPTATKIGDTWFKPSGTETEMLIWTGVVWTNPFLGGDNIADEAITGTKIANATIGSAKIINVDANKITANTLSAITTNTGDLNVSGNLTMITPNNLITGVFDYGDPVGGAHNPRYFKNGYMAIGQQNIAYTADIHELTSSGTAGAFKYYGDAYVGPDTLKLRNYTYKGGPVQGTTSIYAGQMVLANDFEGINNGITLNGITGRVWSRGAVTCSTIEPNIFTGSFQINSGYTNNIAKLHLANGPTGASFNWGNNQGFADLFVGKDSYPIIWSNSVYGRTYSQSANMVINTDGSFGRASSASRYKLNISEIENLDCLAYNLLTVEPKRWNDKRETEAIAHEMSTGEDKVRDSLHLRQYHGLIAEDLRAAGLDAYISYNNKTGEIDGVEYDKLWTLLLPIIKKHQEDILELKLKMGVA